MISTDDIIYMSLLLFSIGFGHIIRKIQDPETRKWTSTLVGLSMVLIVSGRHILHPLFCTFLSALVINLGSKTSCHLVVFGLLFTYLLFFRCVHYFGLQSPPAHTNLVQMMLTLKMVGLAFEVHDSYKAWKNRPLSVNFDDPTKPPMVRLDPGFIDVFHYAFSYVGVLTGPYHRYRTYWDWIYSPFSDYAPCLEETIKKISFVPLYAGFYLLASHLFPLEYATSNEFYNERSVLYRIWYLTPTFFIFRMRIYTGLVLSECVCTMAGLGGYPVCSDPKPGFGPTKEVEYLDELITDDEAASKETYNFDTIKNIDPYGSDFVTTFREGMKCWNCCIQYWLAMNVYKRFPSKAFRTAATMFVSAFWHGVYPGYYLCLCSAPMYLVVEDFFVKHFRSKSIGVAAQIWDWLLWFFKMQAFSYMAIPFLLLHIDATLYYWKSIYFVGHVLAISAYLVGYYIVQSLKSSKPKTESDIKKE